MRLTYERPEAECLSLLSGGMLCVSTGTEPFDDNGNYDWGVLSPDISNQIWYTTSN